jgi:hypothetical protein
MVHSLGVDSVKAGKFKIHLAPGQQAQYEQSGLSMVNFFKERRQCTCRLRLADHR